MRVLFVSDVYFPRVNGVSTSIQTLRRELARLGHESALVAPAYPAPHADDARTVRIASRSVPLDPEDRAMRLRPLRGLERQLASAHFDLVHVQTPFLAHYAGVGLARRRAIPVVATYHTLFEEYLFHYVPVVPRGAMRALARRISRAQCEALDAVDPGMQRRRRELIEALELKDGSAVPRQRSHANLTPRTPGSA